MLSVGWYNRDSSLLSAIGEYIIMQHLLKCTVLLPLYYHTACLAHACLPQSKIKMNTGLLLAPLDIAE